jgi:hypothetical protein
MKPLIHLNYPINKDILLLESDKARESAKPWEGGNDYKIEDWLVSYYTSDYIEKIMKELNIIGKPRFFYQKSNFSLKPHKDFGTQCGVNILLSDDPVPINIEGVDYHYSQALINLQREHSVVNDSKERVLLKFSIPDKSFEQVASEINYVVPYDLSS